MIYFIQCGENGPIKIGQTNNDINLRIAQLQTACPYELNLIWLYKGDDWTEAEIHAALDLYHIRGEWFTPSEYVFRFIREQLSNVYYCSLYRKQKDGIYIEEYYEDDIVSITGFKLGHIYVSEKENKILIERYSAGTRVEVTTLNSTSQSVVV